MNLLTIPNLIESHAKNQPDKEAILDPERFPLDYQHLFKQIKETESFLNMVGIGRNDPVAIILPNGPLMATSFLSVASLATSAPLKRDCFQ